MILDILMSTWGKLITTQDFLLKSDGKFAAGPPVVTVAALSSRPIPFSPAELACASLAIVPIEAG
jgi:hypothetical protein